MVCIKCIGTSSHAMYEIGNYKFSLKYMGRVKIYLEMGLLSGMPKNE